MKKTNKYQLSQWEKSDRIVMEDFNSDNAKIDAALSNKADKSITDALQTQLNSKADKTVTTSLQAQINTKASFVFGTYTGSGTASRTISLGFTPKAVLLLHKTGKAALTYDYYGGLVLQGSPLQLDAERMIADIVSGGFRVYYKALSNGSICCNKSSEVFYYVAFQ